MIFYDNIESINFQNPAACALGNFDGVHLGHQKLISEVISAASKYQVQSTIVTFEPHPSRILNPNNAPPLITTLEKKKAILESYGIQNMVCIPFTHKFSRMHYKDFVSEVLIKRCNAKVVVAGFDYRFGYQGQGDIHRLKEICGEEGIKVIIVEPLHQKGYKVSSSLIRQLIREGDIKAAASFLGRPYSIGGYVVTGDALGRKLGFPTANIAFSKDLILPQRGVYAVTAHLKDIRYKGVANIGYKPTFNGTETKLEVHLFDFHDEIYGEWMEVFFIDNLRREIKFGSPSDLVKQVNLDLDLAKKKLADL